MVSPTDEFVRLDGLTRTYRSGVVPFTALDAVDLTFGVDEFVAVVGPSGSGKSTLLNMIAGIDRPTAGRVVVGEVEVSALSENAAAAWRGRTVGVVIQFLQSGARHGDQQPGGRMVGLDLARRDRRRRRAAARLEPIGND